LKFLYFIAFLIIILRNIKEFAYILCIHLKFPNSVGIVPVIPLYCKDLISKREIGLEKMLS